MAAFKLNVKRNCGYIRLPHGWEPGISLLSLDHSAQFPLHFGDYYGRAGAPCSFILLCLNLTPLHVLSSELTFLE